MLKILVVETTKFGHDGITNVIINYFKNINSNKIHMDIMTINDIDDEFALCIKQNKSKNYIVKYRNSNPLKYIFTLKKILENGRYDIIHVHGCSATMAVEMIAAKLAGVKVRIAHSHSTSCDHKIIDFILRPFFYLFYTTGFACGKEAGKWMFGKNKFEIILNGVDLKKFYFSRTTRDIYRKKLNLEDSIVVGHVGRFSYAKNHVKILDIFEQFSKEHKNAKLLLLGDGELKSEIENEANKRSLDVIFLGNVKDVSQWMQAMDIFIMPSLFEGLPLVLVEAQATGLPCIISDTISPMAKITDYVSILPLKSSSIKWAEEMNNIYINYDRITASNNSKYQIRNANYDIDKNCEYLSYLYENLILK